jgi:hypothetical protein
MVVLRPVSTYSLAHIYGWADLRGDALSDVPMEDSSSLPKANVRKRAGGGTPGFAQFALRRAPEKVDVEAEEFPKRHAS